MRKICRACKAYREVATVLQRVFANVEGGGRVWGIVCVDVCKGCGQEIADAEQHRLDEIMMEGMRANVVAYQDAQKGV